MGEQRPMFRFRLPWMISSATAPPPVATQSLPRAEPPSSTSQPQTNIQPNANPTMPVRRPFRLSTIAPAQPAPPIQPTVESQSKSEPITITSTPKILPQVSPLWSPKISAAQDPLPSAEVSPETKSQSQNSYQPASPSRTHSQAPSQPPSPSPTSAQLIATSQLPSPKSGPQPSSPWRTSSKAKDASQPSSPDRPQSQKSSQAETFHQPQSPPQFHSSDQTSPITSSPSLTATRPTIVQQIERTTTQSPPRAKTPSTTFQPQTNIEPNVNPTTPVRRPFKLLSIAPAQPAPPIQPTVESQSKSEPITITITSTPKILPQAPSLWSPKISVAQDPLPSAEVSSETKSQSQNSNQPASPSRTLSQAPSQPPSPSPTSAQFIATSQLPSSQLSATSQPPYPWRIPSQERDTSQLPSPKSGPQPSSPWRTSSKARDASQPSSPDRPQFQKSSQAETFHQPQSSPQFHSSGQTSPITSSPSLTATRPTIVQQTERTSPITSSPSLTATRPTIVQQTERTTTQSPPRAKTPSTTFQPQTNIEPNVIPTTPVRRPFKLPSIAPAQPAPPIQPTIESQSEPITITSGPTIPPQAPSMWSPKISAVIDPPPQPEVSRQSKSQSQNSSKPVSPSKSHSQSTSQLPLPSLTSAQFSATSHPPSPWRIPSKPSSPDRHQFQKSSQAESVRQPQSPSQPDFQSSGRTSPITSSPSLTATNVQQTERTATRLPSPSVMSTHIKSPQPSASSNKPLSPVSVKPSVAVSQPKSLEYQPETKVTPSVTFNSPTKATFQPTDSATKPPKRDIEMVQNTSLVAHEEPKQKTMVVHLIETLGSPPHNKEKLKIASQAEQRQLKNQEMVYGKEATISKASSLDEKQTKTMTSQQTDNKSIVSESRKKLMISNEDRVPFQKELRNYISMLADKMPIAHPENAMDERLTSVVALVGKNQGASMKLGYESVKSEGSFKIHRINETEPVEGPKANERNKNAKRRRSNDEINKENHITKAFVNNNVQDINNSILINSFITERNPGVHLALYYNPTEPIMSYDRKESPEARKDKSRLSLPKRLHMSPPSGADP